MSPHVVPITAGWPTTIVLGSNYTNNTTTGTEVTGLAQFLPVGDFWFEYRLILQSQNAGTGFSFGVNFDGTATLRQVQQSGLSTGTLAATGVLDDDANVATGQLVEGGCDTAFSTTSPNLTCTTGVATINTNVMVTIEGVLSVTVPGNIELWAASENTVIVTIIAGSLLTVGKSG